MAQPRVLRAGGSPHAASLHREGAGRLCECGGEARETSSAASAASGDQRSPPGGEAAAGPREAGQTYGCTGKTHILSITVYSKVLYDIIMCKTGDLRCTRKDVLTHLIIANRQD